MPHCIWSIQFQKLVTHKIIFLLHVIHWVFAVWSSNFAPFSQCEQGRSRQTVNTWCIFNRQRRGTHCSYLIRSQQVVKWWRTRIHMEKRRKSEVNHQIKFNICFILQVSKWPIIFNDIGIHKIIIVCESGSKIDFKTFAEPSRDDI